MLAPRRLAVHCNYGKFLDGALRDWFLCGWNSSKIQKKLLNTEDLMFAKACSIAKTMEMAEKNTQEFHPSNSESNQVNNLTEQSSKNTEKSEMWGFVIIQVRLVNVSNALRSVS